MPQPLPPDPTPLPSPMHCPVEGDLVYGRDWGCLWEGRRYYFDNQGCLQEFMEHPEPYAREIEPRAALFAPANPAAPAMGPRFLAFGMLLVAGLVTGALASYLAVQKGLPGTSWFCLGFFLSLVGVILVLTRPGKDLLVESKGLSKVPSTYGPEPCPGCRALNHPAAGKCSSCGEALTPRIESEVSRLAR